MVKGSGSVPISNISIGSSLKNLPESGKCDYCHRVRDGKMVNTLSGDHFICFEHKKLAYTL